MAGSIDLIAIFLGGNIEILLIAFWFSRAV
jgi:hypothetical protein